ncbi:hypothetical protein FRC09_006782, partial [Ceratobasidium sp. 395]
MPRLRQNEKWDFELSSSPSAFQSIEAMFRATNKLGCGGYREAEIKLEELEKLDRMLDH